MKDHSIDDGCERAHLRVWDMLPWVVNGTAPQSDLREVDAHLNECASCREEFALQQRVHGAMNSGVAAEPPVERGLERLLNNVDAAERRAARGPGASGAGRGRWAWAAYGLAALVLLEAGGLIALGTPHRDAAYRTLSSPDAALPRASIRLVVDPSMAVGKLQAVLVPLNLQIVGGPNEDGVYSLGALGRGHEVGKDIAALRAVAGVRFVEPVESTANP